MAGVTSKADESLACSLIGPDTAGAAKSFTSCFTSAVVTSGWVTAATASIGPSAFKNSARMRSAVADWSSSTPSTPSLWSTSAPT